MSRPATDKPSGDSGSAAHSGSITMQGGKASRQGVPSHSRWLPVVLCLALALAVWAVFGQTLRHEFVNLDDDVYVTENARVLSGLTWQGLGWAFGNLEAGFWHPLTWLSLMVDAQFHGLHAGGYHLSSVVLHIANTLLLFVLLQRMTGALWRSAVVAALFGLHPLHVESVAWVSERKDVLSTLFWMLTLLCYARCAREQGVRSKSGFSFLLSPFYWLALLFFACGLMSKTMVVTLPAVMLLLDYWPLQRFTIHNSRSTIARLVVEKIPFLLLALAGGLLTMHAEKEVGALKDAVSFPLALRAANAVESGVWYVWRTLWPEGLAVYYPYPKTCSAGWVLLSALLLGAISFAVLWLSRRRPYLVVGWLWYVITLAPVSGLIQIGSHARADRYSYVPLIGIFLAGVWGSVELCGSFRYRRAALGAGAVAILAAVLASAYVQTTYWKDSVSLWRHTLACKSESALAHNNLGLALFAQEKTQEAMQHFEQALRLNPDYAEAQNNLGIVLAIQGNLPEAFQRIERALQLDPDNAKAHYNLGLALALNGTWNEAIQHYQRAIQLKPDYAKAHNNLGIALEQQGNLPEAIHHFQQALDLATVQNNPVLAEAVRVRLKSAQSAVPQP